MNLTSFPGWRAASALHVDLHRVRKQGGADRAMRRVPHAADGGGEAMHRAEPGVGERQSAEQAGPRHFGAGFAIAAVVADAGKRGGGAAHAFHAELVGHRVGANADVGLDQLGEGVESGGGGDGARQDRR